MSIEGDIRKTVEEVVEEMLSEQEENPEVEQVITSEAEGGLTLVEKDQVQAGTSSDEVLIGLAPAYGERLTKTIVDLNHAVVLRELMAGIEEEGLTPRVFKSYDTADVGFIGHAAAQLSGSGIGLGLQSKGTVVIHQSDLAPLANLELFPQAPLLTPELYREIGQNAALYAKDSNPNPVETRNDQMARPKYQAAAAVMHIKEVSQLDEEKGKVELDVSFN